MKSLYKFVFLIISLIFFYGCNSKKPTKINNAKNTTTPTIGSVIKIDGLGLLKLQKLYPYFKRR